MILRVKNISLLAALLLTAAFAPSASAQFDLDSLTAFPDELRTYSWQGSDWHLDSRATAIRDDQGRIIQVPKEELDFDSGNLEPSERIDLAWSVYPGPDTVTGWSWVLTDWFDEYRTIYSYDGQGRVAVELDQVSPLSFWQDGPRTTYFYVGENLTTKLIESYSQGAWSNSRKVDYSYLTTNAAHAPALLSEDVESFWFDGGWTPEDRRIYTYSGGLEIEQLEESWTGSNWVSSQKWLSTYSGQELQSSTFQLWDGSAWNDEARFLYQDYDTDGRARTVITQFWFGGLWQNVNREEYDYDALTAIDEPAVSQLPNGFALSQNYPNPFNPLTKIEYSLSRRSSVRIDVYNMLGQKVKALVNREASAGSYSIGWDGTNTAGKGVSTGFYFYRFQAGDHVETKKMLLLK